MRHFEPSAIAHRIGSFSRRVVIGALLMAGAIAHAELFVSVQDGKQMSIGGAVKVVDGQDTLAIVELVSGKLILRDEIAVPASVIGPPTSVAVTPDGALALVTAGFKRDPADSGKVVQNDQVTVVDLTSRPPRIIDTLKVGKGPTGVSINRQGTLALIANHDDGTVSVLSIAGLKVTVIEPVRVGDAAAGLMHVAITPDGKRALVSREGDHRITVLAIDAMKVTTTARDLFAGQRPDCIDIRSQGDLAVVANVGRGQGDSDTVSLIDLSVEPPRVVDTISVGQTPESAFFSPDGRYIGVNVIDGSNKPVGSPFYNATGRFVLLRVEGKTLLRVASAPIGSWSQGMAFSAQGREVIIQNSAEKQLQVLSISNERISDTGQKLQLNAAPAAMRSISH